MTIFLGCGFAAKYREGGGRSFRSAAMDAWIAAIETRRDLAGAVAGDERTPAPTRTESIISSDNCARTDWLVDTVCFIKTRRRTGMTYQTCVASECRNALCSIDWRDQARCSISAYSIHPPLLLQFERRIFCDLDPSEIFYWMTKLEMGQSYHHEFWTIGLNVHGRDCRMPKSLLRWRTFYPLADTKLLRRRPRPRLPKFTTIGQWYWSGAVEVDGAFPDLSKKFAFEPYLDLAETDSRSAFRAGNEYQGGRSGAGASQQARLAPYRSSSGCAHTRPLPALHGRSTCRIHSHQRRGCGVADRLDKRSRCGLSCAGPAGHYRSIPGRKNICPQRTDSVLSEALMRRKAQ